MSLRKLKEHLNERLGAGRYVLTGPAILAAAIGSSTPKVDVLLDPSLHGGDTPKQSLQLAGVEVAFHVLPAHYATLWQRSIQAGDDTPPDLAAALCWALVAGEQAAVVEFILFGELEPEQIRREVLEILGPYAVDAVERCFEEAQWRLMTLEHTAEVS